MAARAFKRRESVVRREIAGETFLVPIHGDLANLHELFVLNEVGSWIWDRLDEPQSLGELAAGIGAEFEVDPKRAHEDAESFLRELMEAGLADEVDAGAA